MNLNDLDTFLRVVVAGSFTRAAAELEVPKSTVSRRVARLEASLGVPLLHRKARSFTVTDVGQRLHDRCAPALREIGQIERGISDVPRDPGGTLRMSLAPDLGSSPGFAGLLRGFRERYPAVRLEVSLTPRPVDLVEEGIDVAFRFHNTMISAPGMLKTRVLGRFSAGLYASPEYLARRGRPADPDELRGHDCITLDRAFARNRWTLTPTAGGPDRSVDIEPVIVGGDFMMIVPAVVAGMGIGFVPSPFAYPHLVQGGLEPVLPAWGSPAGILSLLWVDGPFIAPRVRAFLDHVEQTRTSDWIA